MSGELAGTGRQNNPEKQLEAIDILGYTHKEWQGEFFIPMSKLLYTFTIGKGGTWHLVLASAAWIAQEDEDGRKSCSHY